ncbi:MAG: HD domain-containing protein [Magnetococcales bacterium]|nr:HD domain-containing protein [Magnetococcales bacterium]
MTPRLRFFLGTIRIAIVLFSVELLIMLVLPHLSGEGELGTWVVTLEDSLLLAIVSTPLNMMWSLRGFAPSGWSSSRRPPFGIVALNIGISVFSVVFSVECGIMLFVPLMGFEEGSFALASADAGLLALVASPIVFFLVTRHSGKDFSSDANKSRNTRRQFLLFFLPLFVLFSLVTEALYFQENQFRRKNAEYDDALQIDIARNDLLKELDLLVSDVLVLAHMSMTLESVAKSHDTEPLLIASFSGFLKSKDRFQSAFLVDTHGKTQVHVDFLNGQAKKATDYSRLSVADKTLDPIHLQNGEVVISGPLVPSDREQRGSVLRFGTPVFDGEGRTRGAVFLDFSWYNLHPFFSKLITSLVGQFQLVSEQGYLIHPFTGKQGESSFAGDQLWRTMNASEKGRVEDQKKVALFSTLHPGVAPLAKNTGVKNASSQGHIHHLHAPTWKMLSWHTPDRPDPALIALRKRLLIFQSLLVGLAAIGSWLFSKAIVNRREADAHNERMQQSQIALNALLETTLVPMTLEEQLRAAIRILSTVPWIGLTGKGAVFVCDPELQQMNLAAHENLNDEEQKRVRRIPSARCLCQREENWRKILKFPDDSPDHVVCLKGDPEQGNYCISIPGIKGPVGMVFMQSQNKHVNLDKKSFLSTFAGSLAGIIERRQMESALQVKHEELKKTRLDIIHRLSMAAEFRDQDTGQHVVRMSKYAALLARAAGLSEEDCENLIDAAPMHDIGKIGIPDNILLKPARLTEQEWETMKRHTIIGSIMLHGYDAEPMNTAHIIALTHHERWDGQGYPIGVSGEEIPIEGRICAIADVFDALTSDRPYKKAWKVEETMQEIQKGAGTAFDPRLVEIFSGLLPEILGVKNSHGDEK